MGFGILQLLIILVIVMLLFGTKRIRNLGSGLGAKVKSFRNAVDNAEKETPRTPEKFDNDSANTIDVEVRSNLKDKV